jgi:hypothetical protein
MENEKQIALMKCLDALVKILCGGTQACFNDNCKAPINRFYEMDINRKSYRCTCCDNEFRLLTGNVDLSGIKAKKEDYYEIAFRQAIRHSNGLQELTVIDIYNEYGCPLQTGYAILRGIKNEGIAYSYVEGVEIPGTISRRLKLSRLAA